MYTEPIALEAAQVLKQLRSPGNIYVTAKITTTDTYKVKVVKADMIALLELLAPGTKVEYSTFNDGGKYPAILLGETTWQKSQLTK